METPAGTEREDPLVHRLLSTLAAVVRWDEPWDVEEADDEPLVAVSPFLPLGRPVR
ncbi:hypothetical protein BH18ACT1_BH18ACT1_18140 [soil metagenome]